MRAQGSPRAGRWRLSCFELRDTADDPPESRHISARPGANLPVDDIAMLGGTGSGTFHVHFKSNAILETISRREGRRSSNLAPIWQTRISASTHGRAS